LKKISIGLLIGAVVLLLGCPTESESDGRGDPPRIKLSSGKYLDKTLVEIETNEKDAVIRYTLDGTDPNKNSEQYKSTLGIRLEFVDRGTDTITVKAVTDKNGAISRVAAETYTKLSVTITDLTQAMQDLAAGIAATSGGTDEASAITLAIPGNITAADLKLEMPNPELPNSKISDGLGALFVALNGKYVHLDLRNVNWQGANPYGSGQVSLIPECHSGAWELRPNRERVLSVIFPANLVVVGMNSLRGLTGIRSLDFSGCSSLQVIDEYACAGLSNLETVDFSGCTELKSIEQFGFDRPTKLKALDLADTKIEKIGKYSFQNCFSLEYIEFPETLKEMHDYCFQRPFSLKYVRFRNEDFRPIFNWCNFLYYMDPYPDTAHTNEYNGKSITHRVQQPENTVRDATDQNFVIFHPDVGYWVSGEDNLFWFNSGASYHHGQNVALPVKNASGYAALNPLRGDALLSASAPEPFRGLSALNLSVSASGVPVDAAVVKARLKSGVANPITAGGANFSAVRTIELGSSFPISGGSANITITVAPTAADLNTLNAFNGQQLTGRYDRNGSQSASENWYNQSNPANDRYTTRNGVEGYDGEPSVYPSDVKFGVLELEVQDGSGNTVGYLNHTGKTSWWNCYSSLSGTTMFNVHTTRYVWVDKDCTIYRRNRGGQDGVRNVYISLKAGWNFWDVALWYPLGDRIQNTLAFLEANIPATEGTPPRPLKPRIVNTIGNGKMPYQNPEIGVYDDTGRPQEFGKSGYERTNPVTLTPMSWVFSAQAYSYPD
jgi:hypothetical protein